MSRSRSDSVKVEAELVQGKIALRGDHQKDASIPILPDRGSPRAYTVFALGAETEFAARLDQDGKRL